MKNESGETLEEAVNDLILNCERPPLWDKIEKAINGARQRKAESRYRDNFGVGSFNLRNLPSNDRSADPEFVQTCLKLLDDKNKGKMTSDQFKEGCQFLDETAKKMNRQL